MKLSVWSSFYIDLSPEDMVLEFEKYGYRYSELSDEHSLVLMERGDPFAVGKAFRAFADQHGLSFPQGHLLLHSRICDPTCIPPLKKQLDLFRAVGVKRAVLHCDGLRQFPELTMEEVLCRNAEALRILTDHIKDTDMVICLENGWSAEVFLDLIRRVGSPNLGICLDTGHLNLSDNKDQAQFIRTAGTCLKALHLADNDGSGDQHILPFARGTVNFAEVIRETKRIEYDGIYNFEIPGERKAPLAIRGFKLEYIRRIFEYLSANS